MLPRQKKSWMDSFYTSRDPSNVLISISIYELSPTERARSNLSMSPVIPLVPWITYMLPQRIISTTKWSLSFSLAAVCPSINLLASFMTINGQLSIGPCLSWSNISYRKVGVVVEPTGSDARMMVGCSSSRAREAMDQFMLGVLSQLESILVSLALGCE
jgi:hypothetical protein